MEQRLTIDEVRRMYPSGVTGRPISRKTLWVWMTKYQMPYIKIGRNVFFCKNDLLEWEKIHKLPIKSNLAKHGPKNDFLYKSGRLGRKAVL